MGKLSTDTLVQNFGLYKHIFLSHPLVVYDIIHVNIANWVSKGL